jgi:hypothetical protein
LKIDNDDLDAVSKLSSTYADGVERLRALIARSGFNIELVETRPVSLRAEREGGLIRTTARSW